MKMLRDCPHNHYHQQRISKKRQHRFFSWKSYSYNTNQKLKNYAKDFQLLTDRNSIFKRSNRLSADMVNRLIGTQWTYTLIVLPSYRNQSTDLVRYHTANKLHQVLIENREVSEGSCVICCYQSCVNRNHVEAKKLMTTSGRAVVVQWLSLLHNLIQRSLNSGSAQVQILLAVCRIFAMVRISDYGPGWK